MEAQIKLKLFATLTRFTPGSADSSPIEPRIRLRVLFARSGIPTEAVNPIFVNDRRGRRQYFSAAGGRVIFESAIPAL